MPPATARASHVVEFVDGTPPFFGTLLKDECDETWIVLLREDGKRIARFPIRRVKVVEDREVPAHAPPRHHAIS